MLPRRALDPVTYRGVRALLTWKLGARGVREVGSWVAAGAVVAVGACMYKSHPPCCSPWLSTCSGKKRMPFERRVAYVRQENTCVSVLLTSPSFFFLW